MHIIYDAGDKTLDFRDLPWQLSTGMGHLSEVYAFLGKFSAQRGDLKKSNFSNRSISAQNTPTTICIVCIPIL